MRLREWENEAKRGVSADVVADAIGHDLRWGTTRFEKAARSSDSSAAANGQDADEPTDEAWALPGGGDEGAGGAETVGAEAGAGGGAPLSVAGESRPF